MADVERSVSGAAAHWDRAFTDQASAEQREAYYALASPLYRREYQDPYFADDGSDWVEAVRRIVATVEPVERALVLGCGLGDALVDFHRRGLARRLHGIDISATAIGAARETAARAGVERDVTFEVGDFHAHPLEEGAFDLVMMVMSLHHALDLERVLARARSALKPGGWFAVNEYVGPSRWQHTLPQLLAIKLLLTVLPRRLRRRPDGSVKGRIGRPTLEWMLATDPSEAAHSAEIPARFAQHFDVVRRVDYGGGIAVPVLDEIVANFRADSRADMRWFRAIVGLDRLGMRTGLVPSANAVLVGRPKASAASASTPDDAV
jgi:SAM-dependent methyltransferase